MPSAVAPSTKISFETFKNVVNGKLVDTKQTRNGINPATKQENAPVPVATKEDLDTAVDAARAALPKWSQSTIEERSSALNKLAEAMMEQQEEFARLLTKEQGKPLAAARDEVKNGAVWLQEIAKLSIPDEQVEEGDREVIIRYTPLGVCGAIVPWNFPIHLACGKIAPAMMTGNTIILKPSPFTPYCGLKIAEIAQAFFPPGVIQALSGGDDLGPMITSHPGIDKISFTGSTATGKKVMESCSKTLKRVTLELGGKDPAIICKDVDIKTVATKIAALSFANSGQICLALKRIYIHESIFDEFRDAMIEHTKTIVAGDGTKEDVTLGPIQNSMQYERVKGFFSDIEKDSLKVAHGGKNDSSSPGYFITPTIIEKPSDKSRIVTEEPFGPILPILSWSDEEDVIRRANDTKMGLGASVWSSNLEDAKRIAKRLEAGSVWINTHLEVDPRYPFSGHKESGIGSEWAISGLKSFCNVQMIMARKP